MAKTNAAEQNAGGVAPAGTPAEPPQQSARDRYRSRYSTAHPDLNLDDEEAFYSQANANLDELEDYRETNRQLGEAFNRSPILAGLVLAAKNGENPFVYLVQHLGPDMDIRELANNPDFAQKMGEGLEIFQKNLLESKKTSEEIGKNATKSLQTLKEIQEERGLSDEATLKMAKDFFGELDEEGNPVGKESFMMLASKGIVTKDMWEALFNARNYDSDIAAASEKARASALNEKVQNGLKKFDTGLPPSMPTGGVGRGNTPQKKGGFASWGEDI